MNVCTCNLKGVCEGCRFEMLARAGGEQGLSASEIENEALRAELRQVKRERDVAIAALKVERTETRRGYERTRLALVELKVGEP